MLAVDGGWTLRGMRDMQFNAYGMTLGVKVKHGEVRAGGKTGPLAGARATLETTGDIRRRVTATRLLTTGLFALALRKKVDDRTLWLTIEGPTFQAVVEVDPKNERVARQWMAEFNTRAAAP